jgi:hypothetical protein
LQTSVMASRTPNLRFIVNEDGAVILDVDHNTICTLNATGAYVWQELQSGKPPEDIITNLRRDAGGEALLIERDVRAFLEDLGQRHLLPH